MKIIFSLTLSIIILLFCACGKSEYDSKDGTYNVSYEAFDCETAQNTEDTTNAGTDGQIINNRPRYSDGEEIYLNPEWEYADFSEINTGCAVMYSAKENRNDIIIAVNAGHGTKGGNAFKTYCHPDKTPKVTGGTTAKGQTQAVAVSSGMTFIDGEYEGNVNLRLAELLRDLLLKNGYDVLMIRNGSDVQLDNIARTVIANNIASCHIAIHFDGDSLDYDKGAFYISVPDEIKYLDNVSRIWEESEKLGECLISSVKSYGRPIRGNGSSDIDLTQTSFSTVPSVDIEMGNQCTDHSEASLSEMASALLDGINRYFGYQHVSQ